MTDTVKTKTRPFDIFRDKIRKKDPSASFQRWAEFDNGTGLKVIYHHWNNQKGTMFLFVVTEEDGEFIPFNYMDDKELATLI